MENKVCHMCNETKSVDKFHLIDSGTRYSANCKTCSNLRRIKRYYANREEELNNFRKRYQDPEYKKRDIEKSEKFRAKYSEKWKARSLTRYAVKTGKLEKQSCSICGDINVQAHHEDYSKPLEVIWFCKRHHAEHHRKYKELEVKQLI